MTRLGLWVRYLIERWMLRGTVATLAILALVLSALALSGATLAYWFPGHHFPTFAEAFWWSVLRISDPGYLSDDIPSVGIRALSVTLSVLGMAVTVGGIVTLVAQLLNGLVERLAAATTPVPFSDHVVILGWTDRTPRLLQTLLQQEGLRVVVLREHVGPDESRQLARTLHEKKKLDRVVLRRGSSMRPGDLGRAACRSARAVVLATQEGHSTGGGSGARQLKAVMALGAHLRGAEEQPQVVVEVGDRSLVPLVRAALPDANILHSDQIVSRTLRLGLQSPGMLRRALKALGPRSRFRVSQEQPGVFTGKKLGELNEPGPRHSVVVGTIVDGEASPCLVCNAGTQLKEGNEVLIAQGGGALPKGTGEPPDWFRAAIQSPQTSRVLIIGWSEVVPNLLAELALEPHGSYQVDLVVEDSVGSVELTLSPIQSIRRIEMRIFSSPGRKLGTIDAIELSGYDRILIVADRRGTAEAANMVTLASVLELKTQKETLKEGAYVVTELLEQEDLELFDDVESVVTSELVGDVLAALALDIERHESLQLRLELQRLYFSRAITLKGLKGLDGSKLQEAARQAGGALVDVVRADRPSESDQVVVILPAQTDSD